MPSLTDELEQCVALGPCSSWHCSVAVISIPGRGMPREEEEEVLSAMGGWLEKQELEGELWVGGKGERESGVDGGKEGGQTHGGRGGRERGMERGRREGGEKVGEERGKVHIVDELE